MLLYYITDSRGRPGRAAWLRARVLAAARAGVDWIQLREKDLTAREQFELAIVLARDLAGLAGCRARLLVNDRLDVALAAKLDGVHLPSGGLRPTRGAAFLTADFLQVVSCHNAVEVVAAAGAGASAVVLGPIFATPSKPNPEAALGAQALRVARQVAIPVLALGGVTLASAAACLAAGAQGLAAIRLFQEGDVAATCAALRRLPASRPSD